MSSPTQRRINGLEAPYNSLQIMTWFLFPIIIVHYFAFLFPLLWTQVAVLVVVTLVFILSSLGGMITGYICCAVDPVDDALSPDHHIHPSAGEDTDTEVFCYLCEVNVHSTSKHCRFCDKCVVGFDHHCKWLNTCIGTKNYRWFLITVAAILLKTTISLVLSIALLVDMFLNAADFKVRLRSEVARGLSMLVPYEGIVALLCISIAFFGPLVTMVYQLACFHILLWYRGQTTYDFIVAQQKKSRGGDNNSEGDGGQEGDNRSEQPSENGRHRGKELSAREKEQVEKDREWERQKQLLRERGWEREREGDGAQGDEPRVMEGLDSPLRSEKDLIPDQDDGHMVKKASGRGERGREEGEECRGSSSSSAAAVRRPSLADAGMRHSRHLDLDLDLDLDMDMEMNVDVDVDMGADVDNVREGERERGRGGRVDAEVDLDSDSVLPGEVDADAECAGVGGGVDGDQSSVYSSVKTPSQSQSPSRSQPAQKQPQKPPRKLAQKQLQAEPLSSSQKHTRSAGFANNGANVVAAAGRAEEGLGEGEEVEEAEEKSVSVKRGGSGSGSASGLASGLASGSGSGSRSGSSSGSGSGSGSRAAGRGDMSLRPSLPLPLPMSQRQTSNNSPQRAAVSAPSSSPLPLSGAGPASPPSPAPSASPLPLPLPDARTKKRLSDHAGSGSGSGFGSGSSRHRQI